MYIRLVINYMDNSDYLFNICFSDEKCFFRILLNNLYDYRVLTALNSSYHVDVHWFRPGIFQQYGYNIYFCWFDSTNETSQFWFKMSYFFIPLWVAFILNFVLSIITYQKLKRLGLDERDLTIFKRLMLFPFIMVITGLFATINEVYIYLTGYFIAWL